MFTTCSHCRTRFRLTAAQLKAAQGSVRCGKCHEVFDAYEGLEGADLAPEMPAPERVETSDAPIQIKDETAPELDVAVVAEDEPITSAPDVRAGSRKLKPPIDDLFAGLVDEAEASFIGPTVSSFDVDAVQSAAEPEPISGEPAPMSYTDEPETASRLSGLSAGHAAHTFAHVDALHPPPGPKPRRPLVTAGGWLSVALLALLLCIQLVDLDRASLSQNPVIGPSLQALYASLGHPLTNSLSVSDWNVGTLNVTTDPDSTGALSITGSLTNDAGFVQPWPLLRVVLTDRFGATLRSRDFKPADYLPGGQGGTVLAPGLAAGFRLDIVDPGADAVGFSLTPCLDEPAGRVCSVPERD